MDNLDAERQPSSSSKFILGLVLATALLFGGAVALVVDVVTNVPDFTEIRGAVEVPIKRANGEKSVRKMGPKAPGWVTISHISNYAIMAVIASEDTSFFSHQGVDFHELKEAIKKDWKEKRWARGASTLTQQVVKNVYLGRQKTLWRKFKEFFWARKMDETLSKTEVLNFYLNMAEWGPGIYGIREASYHYFGVAPSALTARQGAFLAMLLPSPVKYHSYFVKKELSGWAEKRVSRILEVMLKMGFVDESVYQAALTDLLWPGETKAAAAGSSDAEPPLPLADDDITVQGEVPSAVQAPSAPVETVPGEPVMDSGAEVKELPIDPNKEESP